MAPSRAPPAAKDKEEGSTCAASMPSNLSDAHTERDLGPRLSPLLKVSPPTPIGRVAGRFKVQLWRASASLPFGVSFEDGATIGRVAVAEDAPHLGMRMGDEVVSLNGNRVSSARQCEEVLDGVCKLEIQLYHREQEPGGSSGSLLCGSVSQAGPPETPMCCDMCLHPPESRVRAFAFPLRDALLTTGPVPNTADESSGQFTLQIVRMSRKQPFGIPMVAEPRAQCDAGCEPAEEEVEAASKTEAAAGAPEGAEESCEERGGVVVGREATGDGCCDFEQASGIGPGCVWAVKEDLPHLGLRQGDRLVRANGSPDSNLEACKAAFGKSMTLVLQLRRPPHLGPVLRLDELRPGGTESSGQGSHGAGSGDWLRQLLARFGLGACCAPPGYIAGEEEFVGYSRPVSTARTGEPEVTDDGIARSRYSPRREP